LRFLAIESPTIASIAANPVAMLAGIAGTGGGGGAPGRHVLLGPQCSFAGHVLQFRKSEHVPSWMEPQTAPWAAQVVGVQPMHWKASEQFEPLGHVPQFSVPPHPSPIEPQWAP